MKIGLGIKKLLQK